jgi:hypothetical protein
MRGIHCVCQTIAPLDPFRPKEMSDGKKMILQLTKLVKSLRKWFVIDQKSRVTVTMASEVLDRKAVKTKIAEVSSASSRYGKRY